MLLRAIETDVGHITAGKVYESAGCVLQHFNEVYIIIFDDSGDWTAMEISFFEPAVERS